MRRMRYAYGIPINNGCAKSECLAQLDNLILVTLK